MADIDKSLRGAHVLFVERKKPDSHRELLEAVGDSPILLVGETHRFAHKVGMVNFYDRGGSVRFEVNPKKASKRGLKISAKLLALARIVEDE